MVSITLTLFFEDPYWVGLIEHAGDGRTQIGKFVFGAEPSNAEIREFVARRLTSVRLHAVNECRSR